MSKIKVRDWNAVDAHFRNSAGSMKDRRSGRGGSINVARDLIGEYYDDKALECSRMDFSDNYNPRVCDCWVCCNLANDV